jgi:hypothetical protein
MRDCSTLFSGRETPLDLLAHVEVVLNVLKRRVVGQVVEQLAYFVLGSLHATLPGFTLPRLPAPVSVSRPTVGGPDPSRPSLRITLMVSGRPLWAGPLHHVVIRVPA